MMARAQARQDGWVYLLLSLGGMAAAVGTAYWFQLRVAETVTTLVPSLGGLYLSWAAFRSGRVEEAEHHVLADVADQLALAVRSQWDTEVRVRRLNDPYPLPVSWRACEGDLAERWSLLTDVAEGLLSEPLSDHSSWADEPACLAGAGADITEVFLARIPTQRLLIIGEPGTGKTMAALRLLLSLLERREPGGAVPVLFPLASWNPARQGLEQWMAERLARDYTGLDDAQSGAARKLLENRLVLPVLDGFDEIPQAFRGMALDLINSALPVDRPLVLTSRVDEYRDTRAQATGVPVKLSGAASVELQPLGAEDIAAYLRRDAGGGTNAAARWEPVIASLSSDVPVAHALRTPLMLFLARTVYNPRPGERTTALPAPGDLCDTVRFPDPGALRRHLFDAFVPAAYRPHPRYPCRWSPHKAERAFTFLAGRLEGVSAGGTELAWWELPRVLPPRLAQVMTGVVLGVTAWCSASALGRLVALVAGLDSSWLTGPPATIVAGLAGGIAAGVGCGIAAGLTAGLADGVTNTVAHADPGWLASTAASGFAYGFAGGIVGALSTGLAARGTAGGCLLSSGWKWHWRSALLGFAAGGVLWFAFRPAFGDSAASVGALVNAAVYGLAGGAVGLLATRRAALRSAPTPMIRSNWTWDSRGFAVGLACGSTIGITHWAVLGIQSRITGVPASAFTLITAFICAYGCAVGLVHGIKGKPADLATAVGPAILLTRDRRHFRRQWVMVGTLVGTEFLLCYATVYALDSELFYGPARGTSDPSGLTMTPAHVLARGLAYGPTIGLAAALSQNAWWHYTLARHYLTIRHRMPRQLTEFLMDAHEKRGVLRQVGAVYQFRHIDLQRHLAASARSRTVPSPRRQPPTPQSPLTTRDRFRRRQPPE